jgi:glutamyl-tRNA reductase
VNRTLEKARELADRFQGRAAAFEALPEELVKADIVICSTASPEPVIKADLVAEIMQRRRNRSLFFIDIAVPRDVEPAVHKLENVYLYNIDDLESIVAETHVRRQSEIDKAGGLVSGKAEEFAAWYRAWRAGESATLKHADGAALATSGDRDFSS